MDLRDTEIEILSMIKDLARSIELVISTIETNPEDDAIQRHSIKSASLLLEKVRYKAMYLYKTLE